MEAVTHFFNGIANNINGLASNVTGKIDMSISLDSTQHEKTMTFKRGHDKVVLPAYKDTDSISGTITIQYSEIQKYDHLGLKVFLIGYLEIFGQSNLSTQFMLTSKQLEPAGFLHETKRWKFKFSHFEKQYQSFRGRAGQVRYFIRASLNRNVIGNLTEQEQFAVIKTQEMGNVQNSPTLLNVGVDERLHIEFKLFKNSYHIKELVQGEVTFIKVKMPISKMEISLVRRQCLGTPDNTTFDSKTLQTFEVMDGCPDQGAVIPFRMCMSGVKNLTPSYRNIHNRLFIRHWFTVTILDQSGHKYFKQAEITFYRKALK